MLRATAPIPSVTRRLPRGERASHSTFDSRDARSKPAGDVVPLGSGERTGSPSGMARRPALRAPSPQGHLRPAASTRGDPRHPRWPFLILRGLATRGRPRKVDVEDLRQFTNDGHPSSDTRVRVLVVPEGLVMFAEPEPGVLEKREKSLRAPDQCHSVAERGWFPHVSRVKLTNEPMTRFWTFRVDRAVVMRVAL